MKSCSSCRWFEPGKNTDTRLCKRLPRAVTVLFARSELGDCGVEALFWWKGMPAHLRHLGYRHRGRKNPAMSRKIP